MAENLEPHHIAELYSEMAAYYRGVADICLHEPNPELAHGMLSGYLRDWGNCERLLNAAEVTATDLDALHPIYWARSEAADEWATVSSVLQQRYGFPEPQLWH